MIIKLEVDTEKPADIEHAVNLLSNFSIDEEIDETDTTDNEDEDLNFEENEEENNPQLSEE